MKTAKYIILVTDEVGHVITTTVQTSKERAFDIALEEAKIYGEAVVTKVLGRAVAEENEKEEIENVA